MKREKKNNIIVGELKSRSLTLIDLLFFHKIVSRKLEYPDLLHLLPINNTLYARLNQPYYFPIIIHAINQFTECSLRSNLARLKNN